MLDIKITRTTAPKAKPDESNLGFGKKFTDHMFVMDSVSYTHLTLPTTDQV